MKGYKHLKLLRIFAGTFSVMMFHGAFATDDRDLIAEFGNASYRGIEEQPVTLANGRWEGAPYAEGGAARPAVGLIEEIHLVGDLDADGDSETVMMLFSAGGADKP